MAPTRSHSASGKLRIIGGSLRNSRLTVPDRPGLRPTADRVRETLFNWLMPVIDGARCLDLFAGTGALGIEALSRGAAWVDFVEHDAALAQALKQNLERLKQNHAAVRCGDALHLLQDTPVQPYDIAFVDPPFAADWWGPATQALAAHGWLKPLAWIYVESPAGAALALPPSWRQHRESTAGAVRFALYRRAEPSAKL